MPILFFLSISYICYSNECINCIADAKQPVSKNFVIAFVLSVFLMWGFMLFLKKFITKAELTKIELMVWSFHIYVMCVLFVNLKMF